MAIISILNPVDKQRVAYNSNLNIDFRVLSFASSESTCFVELKFADDKDFTTNIFGVVPIPLYASDDGINFSLYSNDGLINVADIGKVFRFQYTFPDVEQVLYFKITNIENGLNYETSSLMLTSLLTLDFTIDPLVIPYQPTKVKVVDNKNISTPESVNITIFACNNALDAEPVWEDITAEYLAGQFYTFTNIEKTADDWAIQIRYLCTKTDPLAGIEISEIFVAHV